MLLKNYGLCSKVWESRALPSILNTDFLKKHGIFQSISFNSGCSLTRGLIIFLNYH